MMTVMLVPVSVSSLHPPERHRPAGSWTRWRGMPNTKGTVGGRQG